MRRPQIRVGVIHEATIYAKGEALWSAVAWYRFGSLVQRTSKAVRSYRTPTASPVQNREFGVGPMLNASAIVAQLLAAAEIHWS